jgi:ubiquinone/menaquinone biosynthesis C-methylase UbiE
MRQREAWWERENCEKFSLLLQHLGRCRHLVDIGCGWGQFLLAARDHVVELWGVDESPHRLKDTKEVCPEAKMVLCRADCLQLPDAYFDVAVTSQMLHEVKLFGTELELRKVLQEIRRVLVRGGRYLLLDHRDAGDGQVIVRLPAERVRQLAEFKRKFQVYRVSYRRIGEGALKIHRRALQDFLTKIWSLNSPMESIEMRETHNVFERKQTTGLLESEGFVVESWRPFSDIQGDLGRIGGKLLEGKPWLRKFLLVATKS